MLQPKRRKFRKEQKGRNTGVATRGSSVSFGDFGVDEALAREAFKLAAAKLPLQTTFVIRHLG